jgi:cell division protein FtsB
MSVAASDEALDLDGEKLPLRPRRRRARGVLWLAGGLAVVGGVASLLIVPTRAWLNQKQSFEDSKRKLEAVQTENAVLEARIAALQTPEEIERIARDRYNLVRAGDQVLAVLPNPAPEPLPAVWPFITITDIVTIRLQHPTPKPEAATATTAPASPSTSGG